MKISELHHEKIKLRGEFRNIRRKLTAAQINCWSEKIAGYFSEWQIYQDCNVVMFYLAMADEVQTEAMIHDALGRGKRICVPLLEEKFGEMAAAEIADLNELRVGKFGLKMPDPEKSKRVLPASIDLIVLPVISFDRSGNRLGFGAGYYDRFLPKAVNSVRTGLGFECLVAGKLPAEEHDVRMHFILTEAGFVDCRSKK